MGKKFVIPSVFTAVDKFSGPLKKMSKNTEASMSRMERSMRKVSQGAFNISRKSAAVGIAIAAPLVLVANEAVAFEESMSNVSTLIDTQVESMDDMGNKLLDLSKSLPVPIEEMTAALYDVRSAGIPAADAMATLDASARLSVAGLSTVQEATNLTTSAINAFASENLSATEITDIMFKTVKFGKTTVSELAQAFGAVVPIIASAGIKLVDFQAATSALTTLGTPAAQAQNQLKAAIISLQKPSKDMEAVFKQLGVTTDKELIQKFGSMGAGFEAVNKQIEVMGLNTAKTWGSTEALAGVMSLTGPTNEAYTSTLLDMTEGVEALGGAFDKQSQTSKAQMQLAKNNMQGLAITLGNALLPMINELMKTIGPMVEGFTAWARSNPGTVKTIMKIAAAAAALSFAISGVSLVVGIGAKAMTAYSSIQKAWASVTRTVIVVQWAWNAAMAANPIAAVVVAVLALSAGVYLLTKAFAASSRSEELNNEVKKRALSNTIDQRVEVTMLFNALRRAKVGSEEYNGTLKELERIQPGIVEQYNLQAGALRDINAAEKELIGNIMKRAEEEARAEIMKEKIKEAIRAEDEGPGFFDRAWEATKRSTLAVVTMGSSEVIGFQDKLIDSAEDKNQKYISGLNADAEMLANQIADAQLGGDTEVINPAKTKQEVLNASIEKTNTEKVLVEFANAPEGMMVKGKASINNFSMPRTTSTK